jgi:tetratricopeptide (TPR) repeat protein
MAIKNILLSLLVFSTLTLSGQNESHHEKYFNKYKKLTQQQLLDTANYYEEANSPEIALVCLSIIINTPVKDTDIEQHKIIIEALNRSAIIYYNMCDYNNSHEFLIKALLLCEKIDYKSFQPKIYNNIGNIYYRYKKYDLAKYNYSKALNLSVYLILR